jgi:NAD(P)-dependent dehydrogenase (short-subunit alcohol dehydrogenase family)
MTCSRHEDDAARDTARELAETGSRHHVATADVTRQEHVDALARECGRQFGSLDVLVSNAGTISGVPFGELPAAEWRRVLDVNLTAAFLVTQRVLPLLSDGASIVYIGSRAAVAGVPMRAHYAAAKAALTGLARSLCKELGPRGIRVNVVCPAIVETEQTRQVLGSQLGRFRQQAALGRLACPQDIADVVTFVASPAAGYVNGQVIQVDGG